MQSTTTTGAGKMTVKDPKAARHNAGYHDLKARGAASTIIGLAHRTASNFWKKAAKDPTGRTFQEARKASEKAKNMEIEAWGM